MDCKEIQPVNPKGNQSWIFIGRTGAEASIVHPPDAKSQLTGKDPDAGKDWGQEEKGMTEDKMVWWHLQLNGREFEQALEDGERQGSLACCSPWHCKQLNTTERLKINNYILVPSPLDCKEIQPVRSERDQPWDFFGRNDAEDETPVLWPPHVKSWLIGKDSDAGRQEEKGTTEDEMAGWHHGLGGRESEWTPGVGDGQRGLACCDSWGHKELDMTEWLNWTELRLHSLITYREFSSPRRPSKQY